MFSWLEKMKFSPGKKNNCLAVKNNTFPSQNISSENIMCRRSISLPSLNSTVEYQIVSETLADRIKKTFPLKLEKSPIKKKNNSIFYDSAVELDSKMHKKKISCKSVLKKILSPKRNNKVGKLELKECKTTVEELVPIIANRDLRWEAESVCSSPSSLIIVNEKFCTSSPIFQQKSQSKIENDSSNNSVILGMSPSGAKTMLNFDQLNNDSIHGHENTEKSMKSFNNFSKEFGHLMHSKSDTELFPLLDTEKVVYDFSKNNRLRHSYPGMSNTTRRESCQELLKCLVSKMYKNEVAIERSLESIEGFLNDSLEPQLQLGRKSLRQTLLEISRRRRCYVSKSSPEIGECESIYDNSELHYLTSILNLFSINLDEETEDSHQDVDIKIIPTNSQSKSKNFRDQFEGFDPSLNEYCLNESYSCLEDDFTFNTTDHSFVITMYV